MVFFMLLQIYIKHYSEYLYKGTATTRIYKEINQ